MNIIDMLKEKDLTAGEISKNFNVSKPSISNHLEILKNVNLITSYRKGQYIIYSLNLSILQELLSWVIMFKKGEKND